MKQLKGILFICVILFSGLVGKAQADQEKLNLPGDNLNLYAVLKIFQESPTLEKFEQKLNAQDAKVNNLDLNGDNQIDYIKVADKIDGSVHNIILSVAINEKEYQDAAVITVQKLNDGQVFIQVIGDEDLYGKNYIIEPNFETNGKKAETPNPGYTAGTGQRIIVEPTTTYVISSWPIVEYIYIPTYVVWESPWHWGYYPTYWRPWRPFFWHEYYGYHYHWNYFYFGHFRRWDYCRYNRWNDFYYGRYRARSPYFYGRRERGEFRSTYGRPDLAGRGSAAFKKQHPDAPSVNDRLPVFNNNTGDRTTRNPRTERPDRLTNKNPNIKNVPNAPDRDETENPVNTDRNPRKPTRIKSGIDKPSIDENINNNNKDITPDATPGKPVRQKPHIRQTEGQPGNMDNGNNPVRPPRVKPSTPENNPAQNRSGNIRPVRNPDRMIQSRPAPTERVQQGRADGGMRPSRGESRGNKKDK